MRSSARRTTAPKAWIPTVAQRPDVVRPGGYLHAGDGWPGRRGVSGSGECTTVQALILTAHAQEKYLFPVQRRALPAMF